MKCLRTATIFNLNNFLQLKSASVHLIAALVLFLAVGAAAETTNGLSDAEIQGRKLAQQLCVLQPTTNFNQNGILKIRDKEGILTNCFVSFQTHINADDWQTDYKGGSTTNGAPTTYLRIIHKHGQQNHYDFTEDEGGTLGYFGMLPVAFCPFCFSSMCDMVGQFTCDDELIEE